MTTIIVSAPIANKPFNGGNAWAQLSYVLGFRRLGFDVYFVEKLHPASCIYNDGNPASTDASINRTYFRSVLEQFGLAEKMALITADQRTLEGIAFDELLDIAESAELLINIGGHLDVESVTKRVRTRAYIDLDPGFTQFWHADPNTDFGIAEHDYYFTIGENIGSDNCYIPSDGIRWRKTRQPAVLDEWPGCDDGQADRFTTIATWRGPYGPTTYGAQTFGSKVYEFRNYASIPTKTDATFEIALKIHPDDYRDREMLSQNSWRLVDPIKVVPDPFSFRTYIRNSGAEFSVAQQMYVRTNCGWFSDRSVRYLSSGKPVVVQDTGFTRNYPAGAGVIAFATPEQAVAGVRSIMEHYSEHAAAARGIAEEYFDSNRVLSELLSQMF
jgi:hypothetical protein